MTASVLKPDPNTQKVQITLFIRTKHNLRIFGVCPLSSYKTTLNIWTMKNEMEI